MKKFTMNEINLGQKASLTKKITEGDVLAFAGITGDFNKIHINEEYARKTKFKSRIAHGMMSVSMIAAVLGSELPGEGSVYVSQDIKFKFPVYIGDVITAELEVIDKDIERNRLTLKTTCTNQEGTVVCEGIGVTMPAKEK